MSLRHKSKMKWVNAIMALILCVTSGMIIPLAPTVKAAETSDFITSVIATPSVVEPGDNVNLEAVVTAPESRSILVLLEVYDPSGSRVFQQFVDKQDVTGGQAASFPFIWKVPDNQPHGVYKVSLGVMKEGWGEQLAWHAGATSISVSGEPKGVSIAAHASPNPATASEAVYVNIDATSSFTLLNAFVEVSVYNSVGFIVARQRYTGETLESGQLRQFGLNWNIPRGIPSGKYSVGAEVLSGDRKTVYAQERHMLDIQVNSPDGDTPAGRAESYITSAHPQPERLKPGELLEVSAKAEASSDSTVLVSVDLYDPSGERVHQTFFDQQLLQKDIASVFPVSWSVPENAPKGKYTIRVGIFKPGWGELYNWNSNAGTFEVGEVTAPGDTTPPAVPAGTAATAGNTEIELRWQPVTDEDLAGYLVYVSSDNGQTWGSRYQVGLETTYTITGLANGTEYTLAVSAVDHAGNESKLSEPVRATPKLPDGGGDRTPPAVPHLKEVVSPGDGRLIVIWEAVPDSDLAGYKVYVSSNAGSTWEEAGTAAGTFQPLTGLTVNQTYLIAVTAFDNSGNESARSNRKSATPLSGMDRLPPETPAGLKAVPGDGKVQLDWEESIEGDLQSYKVYMEGGGRPLGVIANSQAPSYLAEKLKNGEKYTFYVTAVDKTGNESAKSAPAEAIPGRQPDSTPPPAPTGFIAEPGDAKVTLEWYDLADLVEDLEGYRIYISENGKMPITIDSEENRFTVTGLTNKVPYTFYVTALDTSGNESQPSESLTVTPKAPDHEAPSIPSQLQAVAGEEGITVTWAKVPEDDLSYYNLHLSKDNGATWEEPVNVGNTLAYTLKEPVSGVKYSFRISAVDESGNESELSDPVKVRYSAYVIPEGLKASPEPGQVRLSWRPVSDASLSGYRVYRSDDGGGTWSVTDAGKQTGYTVTELTYGATYVFAVTAVNASGKESDKSDTAIARLPEEVIIPADPVDIAPPNANTGKTPFHESVSFLYEGEHKTQFGVQPGAIEEDRVAVMRGTVRDTAGNPLSGVKITVLAQSGAGRTYSRTDGTFDIAANSASAVTIQYDKPGYLSIQRKALTEPQAYAFLPDAVLTPLDKQITEVEAHSDQYQIAKGSLVTDEDGSRQANLLFAPDTAAVMKLPDGTEKELKSLSVRATEFTVGELGQEAMPGELTNSVAYTYAVELSADEAIAAGAEKVNFSKPVYVYIDNFLNHPSGILVPNGYYDPSIGSWVAEEDGMVIKVVGKENGRVSLDVDGDGAADGANKLSQLDLTDAERTQLASMYDIGDSFWRVPVRHFSSFDFNQVRAALPADFIKPPTVNPDLKQKLYEDLSDRIAPKSPDLEDEPTQCQEGSIIGCEDQSLGQEIPIAGTSLKLTYDSKRAKGYQDKNKITIPVTDDRDLPTGVKRIEIDVYIAGQRFSKTFGLDKNQNYEVVWDGKDAYGRNVVGEQNYFVEVRYIYKNDIEAARKDYNSGDRERRSSVFGRLPGGNIGDGGSGVTNTLETEYLNGRDEIAVKQGWNGQVESPVDVFQEMGIAGWKLTGHQFLKNYDGYYIEDWSALLPPDIKGWMSVDIVYGKDGNMYYVYPEGPYNDLNYVLWKVKPNGSKERMMEDIGQMNLFAAGADGTLFGSFDNAIGERIFRKLPHEEEFHYFAGSTDISSTFEFVDGTDAKTVDISNRYGLEVGPDGSLFFTKDGYGVNPIARIDPNGRIFKTFRVPEDGEFLLQVGGLIEGSATIYNFGEVGAFKVGKDGTFYTTVGPAVCSDDNPELTCKNGDAMWGRQMIKVITPDGRMKHVGGKLVPFDYTDFPDDWPYGHNVVPPVSFVNGMDAKEAVFNAIQLNLDDSGNLYFYDSEYKNYYMITPEGSIVPWSPDTVEKLKYYLGLDWTQRPVSRFTVQPDGTIYITAYVNQKPKWIRVSKRSMAAEEVIVPDSSGAVAYQFDPQTGRHLKTLNGADGRTLAEYRYKDGRLIEMAGEAGKTLKIERKEDGTPVAIVAPNGERTVLTVEKGELTAVKNPQGHTYSMEYTGDGLMKTFVDPENHRKTYEYSEEGFLEKAVTPELGEKILTRTELPDGHKVTFKDPDGRVTQYETKYAGNEMTFTVTDPDGSKTARTTKSDGSIVTVYPDGSTNTTRMAADPQWGTLVQYPQEIKLVTADKKVHTTTVTREVYLEEESDPFSVKTVKTTFNQDGQTSTSVYDAAAGTKTYTGFNGERYSYLFDENGRLVKEEEAGGGMAPIIYEYDDQGRTKQVSQGTSALVYDYDELGRVKSVTDAADKTKYYGYDELGRVKSITTPEGRVYTNEYDKNGNVTKLIMPDETVYGRTFNKNGQFESLMLGDKALGTMLFSPGGLKDKTVMNSKREVRYVRDPGNNLLTDVVDPDIERSYGYDEAGRMETLSSTDEYGQQNLKHVYYTLDSRYRSTTWSGKANGLFEYTYDNFAQLSNIHTTLKSGADTAEFDLPILWNSDSTIQQYGPFAYKYEAAGNRLSSLEDGRLRITVGYDEAGRIDELVYKQNGKEVYRTKGKFNNRGLLGSKTVVTPDETVEYAYEYDGDKQLIKVTRNSSSDGISTEEYTYDPNKNLKSRKADGKQAAVSRYGSFDVLEQAGDISYEFDAEGNLAKRGNDKFHYAVKGELMQATVSGQTVRYMYDALGRRTARTDASGTTQYLYGSPLDQNLLTHSVDPGGTATAYLYNSAGQLVAMERESKRYDVITSQVGSPERILDEKGMVVKKLRYDSYGTLISDSNLDFPLEIGFAGGIEDRATGLVRFGLRDYDPKAARWTSRDPVLFEGNQANLYAYVNNNPITQRDPSGSVEWSTDFYLGPGAGFQYHFTPDGWRLCAEMGFGVGGSMKVDYKLDTELPANETFEFIADASLAAGPFASLELGEVYDLNALSKGGSICSNTDFVGRGNLGPITFDDEKGLSYNHKKDKMFKDGGKSAQKDLEHLKKFPWNKPTEWANWSKNPGAKARVRLTFKLCAGTSW